MKNYKYVILWTEMSLWEFNQRMELEAGESGNYPKVVN